MADISKAELRKEITGILQDADLNTMSAKRVRTLLEEQLEIDLTDRKKEVDDLVMKCLKEQQDKESKGSKDNGTKVKGKKVEDDDEEDNDEEPEEEEEEEDDEEDSKPKRAAKKPAASKKSAKRANSDSEEGSADEVGKDASDDEYSPAKKGRGSSAKKGKPGKKKGKSSDGDSDEDWNKKKRKSGGAAAGTATKKSGAPKKPGGYTKALTLTPELAAVVGQDTMARHEAVKKIWSVIKERNLYDPKNKQFAICDAELLKVFGVKRFRTFGMMKYLKKHFISE